MRDLSFSPALAWRYSFSPLLCTSHHIALSSSDLSGQCLVGFPNSFVLYKQLSWENLHPFSSGMAVLQVSLQGSHIFAVAFEKRPLKAEQ